MSTVWFQTFHQLQFLREKRSGSRLTFGPQTRTKPPTSSKLQVTPWVPDISTSEHLFITLPCCCSFVLGWSSLKVHVGVRPRLDFDQSEISRSLDVMIQASCARKKTLPLLFASLVYTGQGASTPVESVLTAEAQLKTRISLQQKKKNERRKENES